MIGSERRGAAGQAARSPPCTRGHCAVDASGQMRGAFRIRAPLQQRTNEASNGVLEQIDISMGRPAQSL